MSAPKPIILSELIELVNKGVGGFAIKSHFALDNLAEVYHILQHPKIQKLLSEKIVIIDDTLNIDESLEEERIVEPEPVIVQKTLEEAIAEENCDDPSPEDLEFWNQILMEEEAKISEDEEALMNQMVQQAKKVAKVKKYDKTKELNNPIIDQVDQIIDDFKPDVIEITKNKKLLKF